MVDVPKEVSDNVLRLIEEVKASGKIKKGTNEATKSIEKGEPKLVVIASDVNPKEIVMHMPLLCEEKKIPCVFVPTKAELGAAAGLPVGTSAIAIVSAGEAEKKLSAMVEQLTILNKKSAKLEAPKISEDKKEEQAKQQEKQQQESKSEEPKKERKPRVKKEEKNKDEKSE